jgi:hypothetical protein
LTGDQAMLLERVLLLLLSSRYRGPGFPFCSSHCLNNCCQYSDHGSSFVCLPTNKDILAHLAFLPFELFPSNHNDDAPFAV